MGSDFLDDGYDDIFGPPDDAEFEEPEDASEEGAEGASEGAENGLKGVEGAEGSPKGGVSGVEASSEGAEEAPNSPNLASKADSVVSPTSDVPNPSVGPSGVSDSGSAGGSDDDLDISAFAAAYGAGNASEGATEDSVGASEDVSASQGAMRSDGPTGLYSNRGLGALANKIVGLFTK